MGKRKKSKIPVYVVSGFLFSGKTTLINEQLKFLNDKSALVIQFESGEEKICNNHAEVLLISKRYADTMTYEEIADKIASAIIQNHPQKIWVEWNGMNDMAALDWIFSQPKLECVCKIMHILYAASVDRFEAVLSGTGRVSQIQLSQSDVLVLRKVKSKTKENTLIKEAKARSNNIKIIDAEDTRGLSKALRSKTSLNVRKTGGILLGVSSIFMLLQLFQIELSSAAAVFIGTWLQAIPFLLLGILLSSAIQVFLPTEYIKRVFPKKLLSGMIFGILSGFCLPICDCVSIPVFRSLIKKGVPLPAAVTFLCAAPVINPIVMISTYYAYSGNIKMVIARVILGIICSLTIALCFVRYRGTVRSTKVQNNSYNCACSAEDNYIDKRKCLQFIEKSKSEFFEVGKYLLIGIGISTFFQFTLSQNMIQDSHLSLGISLFTMMSFAFLLSLCSSSDAVVGKGLGKGLPLGATMGFLVFGPMMDIKNLMLLTGSFSKQFTLRLLFLSFSICFIIVFLFFSFGLERVII